MFKNNILEVLVTILFDEEFPLQLQNFYEKDEETIIQDCTEQWVPYGTDEEIELDSDNECPEG